MQRTIAPQTIAQTIQDFADKQDPDTWTLGLILVGRDQFAEYAVINILSEGLMLSPVGGKSVMIIPYHQITAMYLLTEDNDQVLQQELPPKIALV